MISLQRRGFDLGVVDPTYLPKSNDSLENWALGRAVLVRQACANLIAQAQTEIMRSEKLYQSILAGEDCDRLLSSNPYQDIDLNFECLGSSINQGDAQEIETIVFDALKEGKPVAEDLWLKVAWLSFHPDDASMRFRFSFGVEHIEDVAADPMRQNYAAALADAVFPESRVITSNQDLLETLYHILGCQEVRFVERIVYFNAPEGGAYLHHDLERGHAGVVYAQISGSTFWLALPKHQLLKELLDFVKCCQTQNKWPTTIDPSMRTEITLLCADQNAVAEQLETFANSSLIHLINECKEFVQQLIVNGHGRMLEAGDVLLLPQADEDSCCWHTVFTLGDTAGEALSFAVRAVENGGS